MEELLKSKLTEKSREISENLSKIENYYPSMDFSSEDYSFQPTEKDWQVIGKYLSSVTLYITNRCNSSCKICYQDSKAGDYKKEMSPDKIAEVLGKLGSNKRVILIGGEPTVREDLFEIIDMVKSKGHRPEIFTNGLKLSDIRYLKKLKESGLERVYLSFDGFRESIYEKMRGDSSHLKAKVLALRNLESLEVKTVISSVIGKGINEDQIEPLIDFCLESVRDGAYYIDGLILYGLTDMGRCNLKENEISTTELLQLIEKETDGKINSDYLFETKKLALNMAKFLKKIKLPFNVFASKPFGLYEPGSTKECRIKEYFERERLSTLNSHFEERNPVRFMLEAMKSKRIFDVAKGLTSRSNIINGMMPDESIFIGAGNVNNPSDHSAKMKGTVGIEQGPKNKTISLVQPE